MLGVTFRELQHIVVATVLLKRAWRCVHQIFQVRKPTGVFDGVSAHIINPYLSGWNTPLVKEYRNIFRNYFTFIVIVLKYLVLSKIAGGLC